MPRLRYLVSLAAASLLLACAQVRPPEGGPIDENPPELDTLASTPNQQRNFRPTVITLAFDEWVVVKDIAKQVLISPPVETFPQIRSTGRGVEVRFDTEEPWKDSTTYSLWFGDAIQDRTEGNPLSGLRYVFSTGPVLDSLSTGGRLLDSRTGEPRAGIMILLHRSSADSAVTKNLPDYFARTDSSGHFRLENLRAGTYHLFGLTEQNGNYRYDLPDEQLAFLSGPIQIPDTSGRIPTLRLNPAVRSFRVLAQDSLSTGALSVATSLPIDSLRALPTPEGVRWQHVADTVLLVWPAPGQRGQQLVLQGDTIDIPAFPPPDSSARTTPPIQFDPLPVISGKPLGLFFSPPLDSLQADLILSQAG